jgi:hypothetical protein
MIDAYEGARWVRARTMPRNGTSCGSFAVGSLQKPTHNTHRMAQATTTTTTMSDITPEQEAICKALGLLAPDWRNPTKVQIECGVAPSSPTQSMTTKTEINSAHSRRSCNVAEMY